MPEIRQDEIQHWVTAFHADRSLAFAQVPDDVYSDLRSEGLLDIQNDLTEEAHARFGPY